MNRREFFYFIYCVVCSLFHISIVTTITAFNRMIVKKKSNWNDNIHFRWFFYNLYALLFPLLSHSFYCNSELRKRNLEHVYLVLLIPQFTDLDRQFSIIVFLSRIMWIKKNFTIKYKQKKKNSIRHENSWNCATYLTHVYFFYFLFVWRERKMWNIA